MKVYRYSNLGLYIGEYEAQENPYKKGDYLMPFNSTTIEPPAEDGINKPRFNGTKWEMVEDHRKYLDEKGNYVGGTPYWLPEDDWKIEARYMKELGHLPTNAILTKPEKPQSVIDKENIDREIAEAKSFLSQTDYAIIKCFEQGVDVDTLYPNLKEERQAKRDLVNKNEELKKELN